MGFTDIFIRRPVFASCINLLILFLGILAILGLSVRQYPRSDLAVVTIKTAFIGANSNLFAALLAPRLSALSPVLME